MAVTTTHATKLYNGNSVTVAFPVDFQFFAAADLIVTLLSSAGVETVKTLSTHYTVSGGQDANGLPAIGTLTMLAAPATGEKLRIDRNTPLTQSTVHTNNDAFPAKTVEAAYDRARLVEQENRLLAQRSVKQSLANYTANGELALPSPSADKLLGWNASGDGLVNISADQVAADAAVEDGAFIYYDGATVRTIVGKMRDHFNGRDVGMTTDGVDCAAAWQELTAEIGFAIPSRIKIDLPWGEIRTTAGLVVADKFIHIAGAGPSMTELQFTGTGKFIDFTRTGLETGCLMLSDMMVDTDETDTNTLIYLEQDQASGVVGAVDSLHLRNFIAEASGAGYWRHIIHAKNIGGIYIDGFSAVNDNDSVAQQDSDTAAIFFENDNASINVIRALHMKNFYIQRFYKGIRCDSDNSIESIYAAQGEILTRTGVSFEGAGSVKAIGFSLIHMDNNVSAFKGGAGDVSVIRVADCDLRISDNGGSHETANIIDLESGETLALNGNQFGGSMADNPNPVTAVRIAGDYFRAAINGNMIRGCDVGYSIEGTARSIRFGVTEFGADVTTPYSITTSNASSVTKGQAETLMSPEGSYAGDLDSLAGAHAGTTQRQTTAGITNEPVESTELGGSVITTVFDANAARQMFFNRPDARVWSRTKTGGAWGDWGLMMGVIAQAARAIHTGGVPATQTTDGTDTTPSVTETYIAEVFIPENVTITGIALFNGSAAAGNAKLALANSAGAVVASTASTAQSGTDAYQRVPLSAPYVAVGPGTYYVLAQFDDTAARFNSHILGSFGASKKTGETYGTFTTITPPTTFTTAQGPIASLY